MYTHTDNQHTCVEACQSSQRIRDVLAEQIQACLCSEVAVSSFESFKETFFWRKNDFGGRQTWVRNHRILWKVNLFFYLKCPCHRCPNHLTPFADLVWRPWVGDWYGHIRCSPNGLCSGVQKYYPNTQGASSLRDLEPSKAKAGRENNQHLRWERSTAQKARSEWSGTSANGILQKITTHKWERSDASGLWLHRNPVEQ